MLEWYAGHAVNLYVDHNKSTSLPYHFINTCLDKVVAGIDEPVDRVGDQIPSVASVHPRGRAELIGTKGPGH
jgi:hypothetical protein